MSDAEIHKVTALMQQCNDEHAKSQQRINSIHLKAVKKAMNLRIVLPVTLLSGLLGWVLFTIYGFSATMAARNVMMDTQTTNMLIETKSREMTDEQLKREIETLKSKLDADMKWLIENSTIKYRGANPLLVK